LEDLLYELPGADIHNEILFTRETQTQSCHLVDRFLAVAATGLSKVGVQVHALQTHYRARLDEFLRAFGLPGLGRTY